MATRPKGGASIITFALLLGAFASIPTTVQSIGVNNGLTGTGLGTKSGVESFVAQCMQHHISNIRIFNAETTVLDALQGKNLGLILSVPNSAISKFARSYDEASSWVNTYVKAYSPRVNFQYIAVGNDVSPGNGIENVLQAMKNIANALSNNGLDIPVSTAVKYDGGVMSDSHHPPSIATFSPAAKPYMAAIARYLADTRAPLLANIYPYNEYAATGNKYGRFTLDYAVFTAGAQAMQDPNSKLYYQNLFDAMVDALYYALEDVGAPSVRIVVSESGWPTAGGKDTSPDTARTYNQHLINHVGNGTPKNSAPLETYIYAMYDENQKPDKGYAVERHWGLFDANMKPKYAITF